MEVVSLPLVSSSRAAEGAVFTDELIFVPLIGCS